MTKRQRDQTIFRGNCSSPMTHSPNKSIKYLQRCGYNFEIATAEVKKSGSPQTNGNVTQNK